VKCGAVPLPTALGSCSWGGGVPAFPGNFLNFQVNMQCFVHLFQKQFVAGNNRETGGRALFTHLGTEDVKRPGWG